jgi:hypothetical protein
MNGPNGEMEGARLCHFASLISRKVFPLLMEFDDCSIINTADLSSHKYAFFSLKTTMSE